MPFLLWVPDKKQNVESQNIDHKISKAKYRDRKRSKSQNIEAAEYRVTNYRISRISEFQNIVSHYIEWQNIDHAKYRRTKYRVQRWASLGYVTIGHCGLG